MAKKIQTTIKLQLPAGKATPAPPVGTALGPHGLNIMDFCKQFNAKTAKEPDGMIFPVLVTVYTDRTFTFILKTPPASVLLKRSEEHTSELQSPCNLVCRLLLEKKKKQQTAMIPVTPNEIQRERTD